MENFKPVIPSLSSRILGHPALHIALIFVAVFVAVVFIKGREKQSFLAQVEKMPTSVSVLEKSTEKLSQRLPEPIPSPVAASAASASISSPPPPPPATAAALAKPPSSPSTMTDDNKHQTKLRIIYAEIDDLTLKKWAPEMQAAGQYSEADWKMGVLPNIEKKLTEDRSIVTFETAHKAFDRSNPTAEWFIGKQGDQGDIGLKSTLTLFEPESQLIKGEFRLIRNIEPTDPKVMDAEFELPPKAGWVMWKVLNPKNGPPRDFLTDLKSFFQIYKSPRFTGGRSDFTILLVFDTPSGR